MNFGRIILNQSIKTMQNYATCIQISLLFILKLKIFIKILQMMLKKWFDASNYEVDRPLPTIKKSNWVNERWIRWRDYDRICVT